MAWRVTEENAKKALKWVEERWGPDRKCPICGENNWTVGEVLGLKPYPEDPFRPSVFPVVPVTCTNCGNTHLLAAIAAGLVPGRSYRP